MKDHIFKAGITLVLKNARLEAWSQHIDDIIGEVRFSKETNLSRLQEWLPLLGVLIRQLHFLNPSYFIPKKREHA